jgi:hypothetical protein
MNSVFRSSRSWRLLAAGTAIAQPNPQTLTGGSRIGSCAGSSRPPRALSCRRPRHRPLGLLPPSQRPEQSRGRGLESPRMPAAELDDE